MKDTETKLQSDLRNYPKIFTDRISLEEFKNVIFNSLPDTYKRRYRVEDIAISPENRVYVTYKRTEESYDAETLYNMENCVKLPECVNHTAPSDCKADVETTQEATLEKVKRTRKTKSN